MCSTEIRLQKPRKSTVLRTFRFPSRLEEALETEAQNRGLSPNALVSLVLTKMVNWDRFADRIESVTVTDDLFKPIIDEMSEEKVIALAQTVGVRAASDAMMFWSKEVSLDSFLVYLDNKCRYSGYGKLEYENRTRSHVLVLQHDLGIKWSIFLQHVTDGILSKRLNLSPRFETSESNVTIHFSC